MTFFLKIFLKKDASPKNLIFIHRKNPNAFLEINLEINGGSRSDHENKTTRQASASNTSHVITARQVKLLASSGLDRRDAVGPRARTLSSMARVRLFGRVTLQDAAAAAAASRHYLPNPVDTSMLPVDVCLLNQTSLIRPLAGRKAVTPEGGGRGPYLEPNVPGAEARRWPVGGPSVARPWPPWRVRVCSNRCPGTILGGEFEVSQELRLDNQPLGLNVGDGGGRAHLLRV